MDHAVRVEPAYLIPGDHICVRGKGGFNYHHHGIYMGEQMVIHFEKQGTFHFRRPNFVISAIILNIVFFFFSIIAVFKSDCDNSTLIYMCTVGPLSAVILVFIVQLVTSHVKSPITRGSCEKCIRGEARTTPQGIRKQCLDCFLHGVRTEQLHVYLDGAVNGDNTVKNAERLFCQSERLLRPFLELYGRMPQWFAIHCKTGLGSVLADQKGTKKSVENERSSEVINRQLLDDNLHDTAYFLSGENLIHERYSLLDWTPGASEELADNESIASGGFWNRRKVGRDFVQRERIVSQVDLKPGDHIYVWRTLYGHHGIFVGDGMVIDFQADVNSKKHSFYKSEDSSCDQCRRQGKMTSHGVNKRCLGCFLQSPDTQLIHCYRYGVTTEELKNLKGGTCSPLKADPCGWTAVHRAHYFLKNGGFGQYKFFWKNCESFAVYCKTNRVFTFANGSGQVIEFLAFAKRLFGCNSDWYNFMDPGIEVEVEVMEDYLRGRLVRRLTGQG